MHRFLILFALAGCHTAEHGGSIDGGSDVPGGDPFPPALQPADFTQPLDKAFIRSQQTWLDDVAFDVKWADMMTTPISMVGGASSGYHADLARLAAGRIPGGEVICHGDPKLDNFGWILLDGTAVFSNGDFDDGGYCPAAADFLRFLVATDLWFADPVLDEAALQAYVATVFDPTAATTIDPTTEPVWADVRTKGLADATKHNLITLGGEVQAATSTEISAVNALIAADPRFVGTVLDVVRDVKSTGGSAGMRRFWALVATGSVQTILELKELGKPGTEFGVHTQTLDLATRLATLKQFWWQVPALRDDFTVDLLGGTFVVRDRLTRTNPKPSKLTPGQLTNMTQAEASQMAMRHRGAWAGVDHDTLVAWLRDSSATLIARWRASYLAGGGQ